MSEQPPTHQPHPQQPHEPQPNPQQPYPQPPYGQSPYPQPPYAQQPPPNYYVAPRKSHALRNVLLILLGVAILFVGGCAVMVGAFFNEVGKNLDDFSKDEPVTVTEGEAFERDGFEAKRGWKLAAADFGDLTVKGLEVTLKEDEDTNGRTASFTFRLYDGTRVAAEIDCTSNEMQPGESSEMDCRSFDPDVTYDTIKVASMW